MKFRQINNWHEVFQTLQNEAFQKENNDTTSYFYHHYIEKSKGRFRPSKIWIPIISICIIIFENLLFWIISKIAHIMILKLITRTCTFIIKQWYTLISNKSTHFTECIIYTNRKWRTCKCQDFGCQNLNLSLIILIQ